MFMIKKSLSAVVVSILALSATFGSSAVSAQVQNEAPKGTVEAAEALEATGPLAGSPADQTYQDARVSRAENLKTSLEKGLASYGYSIQYKPNEAIIAVIQQEKSPPKDQVSQVKNVECFVGLTIGAQRPYSDADELRELASWAYTSGNLFGLITLERRFQDLGSDEQDFQRMKSCVALGDTDPVIAEALKDYNRIHYLKLTRENVDLEVPQFSNSAIRDSMKAISLHQIAVLVSQMLDEQADQISREVAAKIKRQQDQAQAQKSAKLKTQTSKKLFLCKDINHEGSILASSKIACEK